MQKVASHVMYSQRETNLDKTIIMVQQNDHNIHVNGLLTAMNIHKHIKATSVTTLTAIVRT